jgi:hypothetical protein
MVNTLTSSPMPAPRLSGVRLRSRALRTRLLEYTSALAFAAVKTKGKEHRQRSIDQGTPNRFIIYPKNDKEMWDRVQGMHPKTMVLSVLKLLSADDKSPVLFDNMTAQIYDECEKDKALHLKIVMWRKEQRRLRRQAPSADQEKNGAIQSHESLCSNAEAAVAT